MLDPAWQLAAWTHDFVDIEGDLRLLDAEGGESVDDLESDDLTGDRGTEICARPVSQELVSHRGGGMDPSETESAPHGLAERSDTDRSWCCRQATVVVGEYEIGKGVVLDDDGADRHEFGGQLGVPIRVCGCAGRPVDSGHEKDQLWLRAAQQLT